MNRSPKDELAIASILSLMQAPARSIWGATDRHASIFGHSSFLTGVDGEDVTTLSALELKLYVIKQELRQKKGYLTVRQRALFKTLKGRLAEEL